MGRQSIDDDRKAINPSCMWGLMNAVDYHHWRYSVLKRIMFPNKGGNHVKGYQIPKFDYDDEQQQTLLQEEEKKKKKKNLAVESVTKKNGSSKKRSIKSRLKSLLANHKTKEAKGKQQQNTKYSSRRRRGLQRTYSIHHLEYQNHDPAEKRSNWDHPIIFIPGKKDVNDEEESSDMKKANENEEFANVLELLKVDKRLYLEIMKNSKDGIRKPSTAKPKAKLVKSGSFPGTRSSSRFKPSKLKDKQSVLKWERFPDSSRENTEGIKLSKALSLIIASTTGSNQEYDEEGEEQERRRGVSFDAFSHTRSVSLNESMDKYVGLIENNFKKEEKLPQSRSLRLRNEDDIKPRLISRIGSLSNADLYTSFQYEEENFPEWPVTFSEEISSYTNEDSKVDDPTYEVDDNLAGFHTESFGDECGFKAEQYNTESTDTCPEKNTSITDDNTDELQESCLMCVPESIDDFESIQGEENKCDDFDEDSSFNNKKSTSDAFPLPGNTDHNYQAETDYIRHILEFSGFNNTNALLQYSSDQQPLKPCLFNEACRPEDLERFAEDLRSYYYYQLLFDLINEELVRLNERLSTYYPEALSYSCRVRVLPIGNHRFVEEVCSDIGKLLEFKPEEIVSLDSIVDYDLKRDEENWMNLQWESESVALEVDHMIFEDLLKELVC